VAAAIYQKNPDKSGQEVTELIVNALRNVRFNDGRGYFFIYKTDGLSVMHPLLPEMEGSIQSDLTDSRGQYIVRDLGALVKERGESFYHWWFVKPEDKSNEYEKIGFGKYFKPYDWFIGTGEYIADVESDIKQRRISRISTITYGRDDYFFLFDYQGNVLSHYREDLQSTNLYSGDNQRLGQIAAQMTKIAKQGEGYHAYLSSLTTDVENLEQKISFISGFSQWQWVIGTGFYKSESQEYLVTRTLRIKQQHRRQLSILLGLSLFVTLFFITLSLLLSTYLSKRFTRYEQKIDSDF